MKFRTFLFLAACGGGAWYYFHGKDQPTDGGEDIAAMEQQIKEMQAKLKEAQKRSDAPREEESTKEEKGNASIAAALTSRTKRVTRDAEVPDKSLSPEEAIEMLQKYEIIDELATGELVSTVDYRVGQTKKYKQNPISEMSKDLMYHFMMYKDGVESLNDYPYIDKIIELYRRANTEQQELQAQGLAKLNEDMDALSNGLQELMTSALTGQKLPQQESRVKTLKRLPVRCLEAFAAAGARIADVETCSANIIAVKPVDRKLIAFIYTSEITPSRLKATNENGWTPFMYLARYATAEDCKKLVEAGADINARNKDGNTALMLATCNKEDGEAICDLLLKAGAGVNEKDNDVWTPLMWAARYSSPELCRKLINAGAEIDGKDNEGWTPLMSAARYSSPEVCKVLIEAGADINAKKKDGSTALMLATCNGENASSICDLLAQNRAEINAHNKDGDTALIWAARFSTGETCKKLVKAGASIDTSSPQGRQVFMQSAFNAKTEVCEILIDAGANVNEKGEEGITALIAASAAGNSATVKLLLDAGADANSITTMSVMILGDVYWKDGCTALTIVKKAVSDSYCGDSVRGRLQELLNQKNRPQAKCDYEGTLKLLEERGAKSITEIHETEGRDFGSGNAAFSNGHNQSQLMNLINRYIAARNDGNAYAIGDLYASQVKYKYSNYRVVSRDAVIRDALPWCNRWTMRNYELLAAGYNENSNTLEIIFRYNLVDTKGKTASGYTKETWVLDTQGKIISWDEELSKGGAPSLSSDYIRIH